MKIDGMEVVDATKPAFIHITLNDVKKGGIKDPYSCAAARACIRDLHLTAAKVHVGRMYLRKGNKWVRYMTPQSLRTEIVSFDRGGGFAAGDYKLSPPPPSGALGVKHTPPKRRGKSNYKNAPHHTIVGIRPAAAKGKGE